jgi:hypothetical protein
VLTTNLKRIYYYTYYLIYKADLGNSPEGFRQWKAMAALLSAELFWVIAADLWCIIVVGHGFVIEAPRVVQASLVAVLVFFNYQSLLRQKKWRIWAREFEEMSKINRTKWTAAIIIWIVVSIAMLCYSFHVFGVRIRLKGG